MALAQRLQEFQRAAATARPRRPQHLQLLQVYADHGKGATVGDRLLFLQRLRQTQEDLRDRTKMSPAQSRMRLQRWNVECTQHTGFQSFREELLDPEGLKAMSDAEMSRTYNQLRRIGLAQEAEKLTPAVSSRLASGELVDLKALLGIWSVAPQELLSELDSPLARAIADGDPRTWDLLSTVSRTVDLPQSKAVIRCAEALGRRLRDLSSSDLAAIGAHLGTRLRPASAAEGALVEVPSQFAELVRRAKAELLSRDGTLENQELIGLLGTLQGREDAIWPVIRAQLLERQDLLGAQLLEICRFIQRTGGSKEEPKLFRSVVIQLRQLLNKKAEPGLVALVERSLEAIMPDERACQALLNTAVRLRKDLYPSVLWTLFIRCGEVGLVNKYPNLQARMTRVGEILEEHGVQRHKMPLREMAGAAEAMRANGTVLEKSLQQMIEQFVEVHTEVMRRAEAAGSDSMEGMADSTAEAQEEPAPAKKEEAAPAEKEEAAPAEKEEAAPAEKEEAVPAEKEEAAPAETEEATASADAALPDQGTNWLGEVQRLMLSFWLQLHALGAEASKLTAVVQAFCAASGRCQIETSELMPCIAELSTSAAQEAPPLAEGLSKHLTTRVAELDQAGLVKVAQLAATLTVSGELWTALIAEINRRLPQSGDESGLQNGVDLDNSVSILTSLRAAPTQDEALTELAQRMVNLTVESLPRVMSLEPEGAGQRFGTVVAAVADLGPVSDDAIPASLRSCLHHLDGATLGSTAVAADVAFSYAAFCRGSMPLDTTARLWRILGASLSDQTGGTDADGLSTRQGAGLWACSLGARHLSSRSTAAALQLAPEASAIEALLVRLTRRTAPCFQLDQASPDIAAILERLQPAIVREIVASASALEVSTSELSREKFQVPGTPYIVDLAFPGQHLALIVPRAEHRALGGGLSGAGALAERLLEALGWRLRWIHPAEWSSRLSQKSEDGSGSEDDLVKAIQELLGKSSPAPDVPASLPSEDTPSVQGVEAARV